MTSAEYRGRVHPRLRVWVAEGLSDAQIARRAGVTARTVLRWRGALGIASEWRPAREERHGTLPRYRRGCKCADCTAANNHAQHQLRRRYGTASRHARAYGLPWSPAEDLELARGAGTVLERAVRLGRTYDAARQRLDELRRRGIDVDKLEPDPPAE